MLLLLSTPDAAAPVTTPPVTDTALWGPWKPIKPRPLVRGRIAIRIPQLTLSVAGTVNEDEDWLLLIR